MRSASLLCGLVVCGLVVGCGGGSSPVGKWSAKLDLPKDSPNAQLLQAQGSAMSVELEVLADKKFKMTMLGFPIEGSYTQSGKTLTLLTEKAMGIDIKDKGGQKEPLILTMSADGKTMTGKDKDGKSEMTFTRSEAK